MCAQRPRRGGAQFLESPFLQEQELRSVLPLNALNQTSWFTFQRPVSEATCRHTQGGQQAADHGQGHESILSLQHFIFSFRLFLPSSCIFSLSPFSCLLIFFPVFWNQEIWLTTTSLCDLKRGPSPSRDSLFSCIETEGWATAWDDKIRADLTEMMAEGLELSTA